ncbi:hypothetical protein [Williamwhitmania taraxaci]|uniref:Uncharacterized protein n=1 Tax=Williamwhitmania taraxaci TaxID=1640674 RepID=A0A1G6RTY1_9BACT|nr:hypothetical protein [Williamwhitmania taraxaci]SDD08150.1 hypothetical protein SAMN05216323_10815 [Williamwhitmania taraxaci]
MNSILLAGTVIVNFALIAYSVAIFNEQRNRRANNRVMVFLSAGILFDIIATICMVSGSTHSFMSSHGILGYSALLAMLIDFILLLRFRSKYGPGLLISKSLHLYSRYAYAWWVIAYITGALIVALRHA